MSENNDGGLAERGGTSNVSGTGSNFGGHGGPTGSGGSNSGNLGVNMGGTQSQKSAGVSSTGSSVNGRRNFTSVFAGGELLPGARAPVVPGYGYTNRKNQTLGDIQEQNRIGNQNYANSQQNNGSNNAGSVNRARQRQIWEQIIQRLVAKKKNPPVDPTEVITEVSPFGKRFYSRIPPSPDEPYTGYTPPRGTESGSGPFISATRDPFKDQGRLFSGGQNSFGGFVGDNQGDPRDMGQGQGQRLQFGGPAQGGQSYTVGENGPETLQMAPGSSGHVTPHNPMDRAIGQHRQFGGPVGMTRPAPASFGGPGPQPVGGGGFMPSNVSNPALTSYANPAAAQAGQQSWDAYIAGGGDPNSRHPGVGDPGFTQGPPKPMGGGFGNDIGPGGTPSPVPRGTTGGGFPGPTPMNNQPLGGMDPAMIRQQFDLWKQQQMGQQTPTTQQPGPQAMADRIKQYMMAQQQPQQPGPTGGFPGRTNTAPQLPPPRPPGAGGFQGRDQGYGAGGIGWHGGNNFGSGAPHQQPSYGGGFGGGNNFGSGAPGGRPSYQGMGFGGSGMGIPGLLSRFRGAGGGGGYGGQGIAIGEPNPSTPRPTLYGGGFGG